MTFFIDDEENAFSDANLRALEVALGDSVVADVPLCVEFLSVGEEEIRRLNAEMRNVDKVTDVLSFPTLDMKVGEPICGEDYPYDMDEQGRLMIGSIVVCKARAAAQAEEYGHSYERELHYLLVHGVMHCLGYDHETDEQRACMRAREEAVLNKLGITRE